METKSVPATATGRQVDVGVGKDVLIDPVCEGIVEDVKEVLHEVFKGEPIAERWKDTLPLTSPAS